MATDNKYVKYQSKSVKLIDKPEKGENISVYVRPGDEVDFKLDGINLEDLEYELVGGDIVIDIPNKGSFTFVSMALMGYNDTPPTFSSSSGKELSLGDILSEVEEINSLPIDALVSNIDINIPDATCSEDEDGEASEKAIPAPPVIIQEIEVFTENDEQVDEFDSTSEFDVPPVESPIIIENVFTSNNEDSSSSAKTEEAETEGAKPTLSFDIDIQHVQAVESSEGNTLIVNGGGGIAYDNVYGKDSFQLQPTKNQTASDIIDYSNVTSDQFSNVVINADDSDLFTATTTSRTIAINPIQGAGFAVDTITISGADLPNGFKVQNATQSGNSWVIKKDDPNTDEIDGFTIDSSGKVQITFTVNNNEAKDFELVIKADSKFSLDNLPEKDKADFQAPVQIGRAHV